MPKFTVRVVLHDIPNKHHATYQTLHDDMEADGFSREIVGTNGTYHLPPAEYIIEVAMTAADVCRKARAIADNVHANNGVLVTEATRGGYAWLGLDKV